MPEATYMSTLSIYNGNTHNRNPLCCSLGISLSANQVWMFCYWSALAKTLQMELWEVEVEVSAGLCPSFGKGADLRVDGRKHSTKAWSRAC